jgi:hypothetical protein
MTREIEVRKTTLAEADDEARDGAFWAAVEPAARFVTVFRLSEEAYALSGRLSPDSEGRARSVACVVRS